MNDNKTTIHMVPEPRKSELVQATYGIIGCMQQVHNQLGPPTKSSSSIPPSAVSRWMRT